MVVNSVESALEAGCQSAEKIFVIGGSTLYESFLPVADTLYITQINKVFEGDTFFPKINEHQWAVVEREDIDDDPDVTFGYSFLKLEKAP